jgi:hypothetical protein
VLADLAAKSYPLAKGWILALVETLRTNTRAAEALNTDKPAGNATWSGPRSCWRTR